MNNKKVAFIVCVNNDLYYEECLWYIKRLILPENFMVEVIKITDAKSMTEAYNRGMYQSDAKYKIYLHQDVFVYNKNFIFEILNTFQSDVKIGMIGLVGGIGLPSDGIIYNEWNIGRAVTSNWLSTVDTCFFQKEPYIYVDAVDGMLIATQYDIEWRDDILKQWDFYDISQSFEFKKAGYNIVIPYQSTSWVIHDCGYSNLSNYDKNRKLMFEYYPEFFVGEWDKYPFQYNYELYSLTRQLYMIIDKLVSEGSWSSAEQILQSFEDIGLDKNMLLLKHIFMISKWERESLIESNIKEKAFSVKDLIERYTKTKFTLRRIEIGEVKTINEISHWIIVNDISPIEIILCIIYNIADKGKVVNCIEEVYLNENKEKHLELIRVIQKELAVGNLDSIKANKEVILKRRADAEAKYREKTKSI